MILTKSNLAFAEARPEISDLIRIAKTLSDVVEPERRMSRQENQLRQVIVALIGVIQSYVSELLEERADELSNTWDELNELDKRYVAVQATRRLGDFLGEFTESDLAEPRKVDQLRTTILQCADWHTTPSLLARSAYREKLDGFLHDNGSKTLDRVITRFGDCGLTFFNWLNKNYPRYRGLEDLLNIIIETRNDVAHGTFRRRVTLREVRIHRVLIYRLVTKIEPFMNAKRALDSDFDPSRNPGARKGAECTADASGLPTYDQIAQLAHEYWVERGYQDGHAEQDWHRAERELRSGLGQIARQQ